MFAPGMTTDGVHTEGTRTCYDRHQMSLTVLVQMKLFEVLGLFVVRAGLTHCTCAYSELLKPWPEQPMCMRMQYYYAVSGKPLLLAAALSRRMGIGTWRA